MCSRFRRAAISIIFSERSIAVIRPLVSRWQTSDTATPCPQPTSSTRSAGSSARVSTAHTNRSEGLLAMRARLCADERVVALDPAIRGEDEDVQPDCEQLAVLVARLPVELEDIAELLGVVTPPEAEALGGDPVLVRARHPSLDLLVSPCLEDRRQPDAGLRRDRADLLRRLHEMPPVLRPELGDRPAAPVAIGLVPERAISGRQLRCRLGPGLGRRDWLAHLGSSFGLVAHVGNDPPGNDARRLPPMCSAGVTVRPVAVRTESEPQTVGELIRFWRTQRRLTQMELALDANVSTKHLSFVETGRSRPSRQLLAHLAQ